MEHMKTKQALARLDLDNEQVKFAKTPEELKGHLEIAAIDGDREHLKILYNECAYIAERCRNALISSGTDVYDHIGAVYSLGRKLSHLYSRAIQLRLKGFIEDAMNIESRLESMQPEFDEAISQL